MSAKNIIWSLVLLAGGAALGYGLSGAGKAGQQPHTGHPPAAQQAGPQAGQTAANPTERKVLWILSITNPP